MFMNKKEFDKQVRFHQMLVAVYPELAEIIKSEEFKQLDSLNKDMAVAQINALQTLIGITSIRIGLNAHLHQEQANSKDAEPTKEVSNEQERTTTKESKSEQ